MELSGRPVEQRELAVLGLVGYGHFTSMRVEANGAVRGFSLHMERLERDAREVFAAELDRDHIRSLIRRTLTDIDVPAVARVTVFDPDIELSRPGAPAHPQVLVTARPAPATPVPPLSLQSAVYARDLPRVKHIGLFGALHQRAGAQRAGFDDVVFASPDGAISEIATSNIGFVRNGDLIWPHADVLPGVTMQLLSQTRDKDVLVEKVTLADLDQFQAVIATNAAVGVRAVRAIDDNTWDTHHELIDVLRKEYEAIPPERI
ncbi:aminotransferase class IV [Nocardia thailandica]